MQVKSELERVRATKDRSDNELQRAHIRVDELERANREKEEAKRALDDEIMKLQRLLKMVCVPKIRIWLISLLSCSCC